MQNDTVDIEIINLHPKELALIYRLRSQFQYGEVTILMRDGLPFRLRKVTEFAETDTLGKI